MIKTDFKEKKGITLITLVLAILIMIIISTTLLYNARYRYNNKKFKQYVQ